MITAELLNQLKSFSSASWAIWPETTIAFENSFFYNNLSLLKSNIVYLGINPSSVISAFNNFHTERAGDKNLATIFSNESLSNIKGGYMTDLDNSISPTAKGLTIKYDFARRELEKQLKELKEVSRIICFGSKTFRALKKIYNVKPFQKLAHNIEYFKFAYSGNEIIVYGCYHYSSLGWNKEQANIKLREQLQFINDFKK